MFLAPVRRKMVYLGDGDVCRNLLGSFDSAGRAPSSAGRAQTSADHIQLLVGAVQVVGNAGHVSPPIARRFSSRPCAGDEVTAPSGPFLNLPPARARAFQQARPVHSSRTGRGARGRG
jgi:hypothetical protein